MTLRELKERILIEEPFTIHQARAVAPKLASSTLTRWEREGLILRLRRGFYAFPETVCQPGFALRLANQLYSPSYVSTYTALSFYGFIPEGVVEVTSVSPLKTASFRNDIGNYDYRHLSPRLFRGWQLLAPANGAELRIATPEKALLDLLWLDRQYESEEDFLQLRLDVDLMASDFNREKFIAEARSFDSPKLLECANRLLEVYG